MNSNSLLLNNLVVVLINADLKVLVGFIQKSPLNQWGENTYLNQLDTLVKTYDRDENLVTVQLDLVDKLIEEFGWKRHLTFRILQKIDRGGSITRVIETVKRNLTELTMAHYSPWFYKKYYIEIKNQKIDGALKRNADRLQRIRQLLSH